MTGRIIGGRYELLEQVGEGGMAVVYKAHCRILDRIVAVKILKTEYSKDDNFVRRFKVEAQAAARLSHANIVNIYDVGQEDNIYYIVMEFIEGMTLRDLIDQKGYLSINEAIDITIMICDGLNHAHEKGLIHRDIKPHNILLTNNGMIKVADFGIAHAISKKTITFGGDIVGSVHYISPEQARGEPLTRATDIYSTGCVLYEMLTGQMPYDAESPITVALKHIHDDVPLPRSANPDIPAELERVVLKSMDKMPLMRYPTTEAMRNELLYILNSGSLGGYASRRTKNGSTVLKSDTTDYKTGNGWSGADESAYVTSRRMKPGAKLGVIAIIAVLGLIMGVLYQKSGGWFGQEIEVPRIEGLGIKEANDELAKYNLNMNIVGEQFSEEVDKDLIISQKPDPGSKVKAGREIEVVVSKGAQLAQVPNLVGVILSEAEIMLRNSGLELGEVEKKYDDKYEANMIISQKPLADTEISEGEKVDLLVSQGPTPEKVSVPELYGLKIEEAESKLKDKNLLLGEVKRQESDQQFSDYIIDQDVAAGVLADERSAVNVTVSSGPGPVARSKTLTVSVPDAEDYYKVVINIKDAKGTREVYNRLHRSGDKFEVGVSYFGNATASVLMNGKEYQSFSL